MMLGASEIVEEVRKGRIKITPFVKENVSGCSINLTLDNEFRVYNKEGIVRAVEEVSEKGVSKLVKLKKGETFLLKPEEMILGITKERITLSEEYCGIIDGRSRFARIGLMVHISSSLIQPGSDNKQVLEILNVSPFTIELVPGTMICKVAFVELKGKGKYRGKYWKQTKP